MSQVSIACGLPFCQSTQNKQTPLSIGIRATAIVVGIIAATIGVLIVLNVPGLGQIGTTAGWATFSIGAFITFVGASLKCIKKSEGRSASIRGKPLVVPNPIAIKEVSQTLIGQFTELKKSSAAWIGAEKKAITIGKCAGCGGAKRAMEISEDAVLMLPNAGNEFNVWRRMVDEEVQISDRLTELGILTVQSKKVDLYLSEDSDQPLPAYICPSFRSLTQKGMYVIDGKNQASSCWQGIRVSTNGEGDQTFEKGKSYFKGDEDRYSVESWLPIVKPLLQDIYTLAKNNVLFCGDSLNIVIIENEQGYRARYFGFDFSAKHEICTRVHKLREDDVTDEVVKIFGFALAKVFWEQHDFDTGRQNCGLGQEYNQLIEVFKNQYPAILQEMHK